jgi:pimeloyl-ACP methyl ester carboxylesterase
VSAPAATIHGSGDTAVLLLHGIGGGRSIWDDAASGTTRALAEAGYCAVAVDLPGYGDSAAMGAPDLAALVDGVRAVMRTVRRAVAADGARRVVLVGHSMGGMVAQELLARDPAGVDGLVLTCTTASFGKADGAWQAAFLAERLAPLDAGLGMVGMAERLVPGLVSPAAPAQALAQARAVMGRVPEATYRAALQAIAGFDRRATLATIRVPTLLLAAEHDRTAPPDVMQRMAARIAGSDFVCLPKAGHIANVEAPAAFNAAVLTFLQRHFPVA